jgi:hypothetical protein
MHLPTERHHEFHMIPRVNRDLFLWKRSVVPENYETVV